MPDHKYFQEALSNFTFGMTSFGAICHLADNGYTIRQIKERLDVPVSYEKLQKTVWEHLMETHVLLLEEPGGERAWKMEICAFDHWHSKIGFQKFLSAKCRENGEETAYISCDFGIMQRKQPEKYTMCLGMLDSRQRDYIEGLPWTGRRVYHRLNQRMREIVYRLQESGEYQGICYFLELGERIVLQADTASETL